MNSFSPTKQKWMDRNSTSPFQIWPNQIIWLHCVIRSWNCICQMEIWVQTLIFCNISNFSAQWATKVRECVRLHSKQERTYLSESSSSNRAQEMWFWTSIERPWPFYVTNWIGVRPYTQTEILKCNSIQKFKLSGVYSHWQNYYREVCGSHHLMTPLIP